MDMTNTIPFAAPSQFRLHVAVDPQGTAYLAVLNQFDQPSGNLHHMTIPFEELKKAHDGSVSITARGPKASFTLKDGSDNAHAFLMIEYEDPENYVQRESMMAKEDFEAVMDSLAATTA